MELPETLRRRQLLLFGFYAIFGLQGAVRLAAYDSIPWILVAVCAAGGFLLAGPVTWVVRDRVSKERRENLTYVAFGAIVLGIPLLLGLGLLFGGLLVFYDAGVPGGFVGLTVALLVERTVVPERLRSPTV